MSVSTNWVFSCSLEILLLGTTWLYTESEKLGYQARRFWTYLTSYFQAGFLWHWSRRGRRGGTPSLPGGNWVQAPRPASTQRRGLIRWERGFPTCLHGTSLAERDRTASSCSAWNFHWHQQGRWRGEHTCDHWTVVRVLTHPCALWCLHSGERRAPHSCSLGLAGSDTGVDETRTVFCSLQQACTGSCHGFLSCWLPLSWPFGLRVTAAFYQDSVCAYWCF